MQPFKLMIIDDDLERRKKVYENVLSNENLELSFIRNLNELKKIFSNTPVDGYVIDVFLDTGSWEEVGNADYLLSTILCNFPRATPVFLVSQNWGDPEALKILTELNRKKRDDINVLRYLAWQEFEAVNEEIERADIGAHELNKTDHGRLAALRNKLHDDLSVWHERSTFRPKPYESIRILLLADLQYGDPHTSNSAVFDEQWLVRRLNKHDLNPDFVVLAGDIGYSGAPEDYHLAKTKLEPKLFQHMWDCELDKLRERIILVPGNHDVNLRIAACERHNWNRDKKEWEEICASKVKENLDASGQINYNDLALEPFRQFARDITGSRLWDSLRIRSRVDRRFELCGIRFYLFNTVAGATVDTPKKNKLLTNDIERITSELGKHDKPENYFNIAISHHGIKNGSTSNEQIENWEEVGLQFFIEHQINLWMFGHNHEFKTSKIDHEDGKQLGLVQSPTLKVRPDETTRGFSLIELERSANEVVAVKVYSYTLDKNGIKEKTKPNPKTVWEKTTVS